MSKNVSYQTTLDGKSSNVISSNPVNDPKKVRRQGYNSFDLDYEFYCTERYSDISPFYVSNGVPKDINPLINHHELRTYTLQAPLMADVFKHKNYFQIPMKAILPNSWDIIFKNPTQGDDVPSDAYCSCDIVGFARGVLIDLSNSYNGNHTALTSSNFYDWLGHFLRQSTFLESVFSTGSLLCYLGFPAGSLFIEKRATTSVKNFDDFMDQVVTKVLHNLPQIQLLSSSRYYTLESNPGLSATNRTVINYHRFMEIVREDPRFVISNGSTASISEETLTLFNEEILPFIAESLRSLVSAISYYVDEPIDISRLAAYQLCCAHFYSNDSVDFIYSADLFRKNLMTFYLKAKASNQSNVASVPVPSYDYNGTFIHYDAFSAKCFKDVSSELQKSSVYPHTSTSEAVKDQYVYCWFSLILQMRHSIKYGDYFTGSKPFPLAVGDVSAPVVNDTVSAIDMTVNISKQRFLNAVNRFGSSVDDYVSGIFDSKLPPVDTDPKWLANESFKIFGTEIENTGAEQRDLNSVTTILKSNGGKYAFEAYCDVPCIFLGLSWYSIKRAYVSSADRFFFHKDRYDMFNPYMQYIGDQPILPREISVANRSSSPFAYTGRYMEYKQRVSKAVGGFANNALPNWSPATSSVEDMDYSNSIVISPDFIRSKSDEFDKYYSSLTNISLGRYFHFIVKYSNFNSIKRAMDYSPSIL